MKNNWETIVGNVGTVYTGTNGFEARKTYSQYVAISKNGLGHAGHENVTLMKNDEPYLEYVPSVEVRLSRHNIEVFKLGVNDFHPGDKETWMGELIRTNIADEINDDDYDPEGETMSKIIAACQKRLAGWYWWTCCPGCMPDSEAFGPFKTWNKAAQDALEGLE